MESTQIQRLTNAFSQAYEMYKTEKFEEAENSIIDTIKEAEEAYKDSKQRFYSFGHELEIYYFSYLKNYDKKMKTLDFDFTEVDIAQYYRLLGAVYIARYQKKKSVTILEKACKAYDDALKWNPVDLDAYFQLIEIYKELGRVDSVRKAAQESYLYCCTRATVAHYYRSMGYVYLEKFQPETAVALYQYSNIFYHSESADSELDYLSKALNRKLEQMPVADIQKVLEKNHIPTGPCKETVEITYGVAELAFEKEKYDLAKDCYTMVYDITEDAKVEEKLRQLSALSS